MGLRPVLEVAYLLLGLSHPMHVRMPAVAGAPHVELLAHVEQQCAQGALGRRPGVAREALEDALGNARGALGRRSGEHSGERPMRMEQRCARGALGGRSGGARGTFGERSG